MLPRNFFNLTPRAVTNWTIECCIRHAAKLSNASTNQTQSHSDKMLYKYTDLIGEIGLASCPYITEGKYIYIARCPF